MRRERIALVFAMVYPTLVAWFYFVFLASGGQANLFQQLAYPISKVIQFGFPLAFLWWHEGRLPRPTRPRFTGLPMGLFFGLLVALAMLGLYHGVLRDTALFEDAPELIAEKLREFDITTVPGYIVLAVVISLIHSLLEEYYWRWFVFGRLRRHVSFSWAISLSSLAFMSHHVIVLATYLPGYFWIAVVPFSLGIAVGGAVWAWLYERSGSIYSPWLSHLLVDGAIYILGYDLLRKSLFA